MEWDDVWITALTITALVVLALGIVLGALGIVLGTTWCLVQFGVLPQ